MMTRFLKRRVRHTYGRYFSVIYPVGGWRDCCYNPKVALVVVIMRPSMTSNPLESNPHSPKKSGDSHPGPVQRRRWESSVEQQIAEARERGEFDNLPGQGRPLRLEDNPFAKDRALAYSLLKNNHMAPPEIERGKEIDEELKQAEALITRLRYQRDRLVGRAIVYESDRRSYDVLLASTEQRYREALRAINRKILSLNIITPPDFHRRRIDVESRMRAFLSEFRPLLPKKDG
jgi:DnaJ homolog subfamily C member 28